MPTQSAEPRRAQPNQRTYRACEVTHTPSGPASISLGLPPTRTVATTRRLRASIRDTVPSITLATHTAPGVAVTPAAPRPTATAGSTRLERASIGTTVSSRPSVIHAAPSATTTDRGGKGSAIVF